MAQTKAAEEGAYVKGWLEARREDQELTRLEQDLASQEAGLETQEESAHRDLLSVQEDLNRTEALLQKMMDGGVESAGHILRNLPRLAPPPGVSDKKKALAARREALERRRASAESRKKALDLVAASVKEAREGFAQARQDAELLQKQSEDLRAKKDAARKDVERQDAEKQAAERRAAEKREAGKKPAPVQEEPKKPAAEAPKEDGRERRQATRIRLDCEVDMETETNFFAGFGWDISSGGLFVAAFDPIPMGSEVDISFTLPGGTRVETKAVVRWARDLDRSDAAVLPGVGLQFVSLSAEHQKAIETFIRQRDPLFYST